jgi:hypothetical protein
MKKNENLKTINEIANKIKAEKCDLTKEQFKESLSEIMDSELSLDDLDEVSGGAFPPLHPAGNS